MGPSPQISISRSSSRLSNAVYDSLKERLLDGLYARGERLSVEEIRGQFGVSKQPVMEALRRLSSEGMVDIVPQVGSIVATYDMRAVEDFFFMFGSFEGSIASVAAERRTPAQLIELDRVSQAEKSRPLTVDEASHPGAMRAQYRRFHELIHDMAHSRIMAETSRKMWDLSDFLINTAGGPHPLANAVDDRHDDHDVIRRALASGDGAGAQEAMERHIRGVVQLIGNARS